MNDNDELTKDTECPITKQYRQSMGNRQYNYLEVYDEKVSLSINYQSFAADFNNTIPSTGAGTAYVVYLREHSDKSHERE